MRIHLPDALATPYHIIRRKPASTTAFPFPTEQDAERFAEILNLALDTGIAAALERRRPLENELDPIHTTFGAALARLVALKVSAVR